MSKMTPDDVRAASFDQFLTEMAKDKPGEVLRLDDSSVMDIEVVPTGAISLDVALGIGGLPYGRITELFGPTGGGKCLVADTYVWTDHGLETIEEIFAHCGQTASDTIGITDITELGLRVITEEGGLDQVAALTHNGLREVRRIQLASGRYVDATMNHPLRVMDTFGWIVWRNVGEIVVGDRVVSASFGATDAVGSDLSSDEAVLLGYLVGEGVLDYTANTHLPDHDAAMIADYEQALGGMIGDDATAGHHAITAEIAASKKHGAVSKELRAALHERYGDKAVPYRVRIGGRKAQQLFLSALMESDGWIADEHVGFSAASEQLVREVQMLFLGLGMEGAMHTEFNTTSGCDHYYLALSQRGSRAFLDEIGFRTKRYDVALHTTSGAGAESADLTRAVPGIGALVQRFHDAVESDHELDQITSQDSTRDSDAAMTPAQLGRIVAWARGRHIPTHIAPVLAYLTYLADSRFVYDEVTEVADLGAQPTFDVVVPETHSFIANGILSHNTTLALQCAANCQKTGGRIGFIDAEHALSRELALNVGIDPSRFVVFQPDDGEQAIDMAEKMLGSGAFEMVIVDSVAAMTPRAEIEAEIDQQHMALHARLMSKFMRRVVGPVQQSGAVFVLINQVRTNLGAYGAPDTTTGGKAIPFFSSVRIEVRSSPSKVIERDKVPYATTVTATVKKNKLASPFRKCEYDLVFGQGISSGGSLLEVCQDLGLITRGGSSYTEVSTGVRIAVGKEAAKSAIEDDKEMAERLTTAVYDALTQARVGVPVEELSAGDAPAEDTFNTTSTGVSTGTSTGASVTDDYGPNETPDLAAVS